VRNQGGLYNFYRCCGLLALSQGYEPVQGYTFDENYFGCQVKQHTLPDCEEYERLLEYLDSVASHERRAELEQHMQWYMEDFETEFAKWQQTNESKDDSDNSD
jgi:hypothetical protein